MWPFRKQLAQMQHAVSGWVLRHFDILGPKRQRSYDIGDGTSASVLMAPVQWIQRSLPEAPLVVQRQVGDEWELDPEHEAARLLEHPNDFYSGTDLLAATTFSWVLDGNAYWIIVPNGAGRPVQLWWVPHWLIKPTWPTDGSEFIDGYEYTPGGQKVRLEIDQVIHFRHGIDPQNPRLGISPIRPALKSIWADMEADEFIATLLDNVGVPGLVISPDTEQPIDPGDVDEFKRRIKEQTTGGNRGEPLVATARTRVDRIAWSPREMDLTAASDRFEERTCALLGMPAAVVGFHAGLEQTQVGATMNELRKLAWSNGIVPMHRAWSGELNRSYLPLFRNSAQNRRIRFDRSEVEALQESRDAVVERATRMVTGGWLTVSEAKRMVGMEPEPGDDVYLRGISTLEVPAGSAGRTIDEGVGERGAQAQLKHEHSEFEERISRDRPRRNPGRAQLRFVAAQERAAGTLESKFSDDLSGVFSELGTRAAQEAAPILEASFKDAGEDRIIAERILDGMGVTDLEPMFRRAFERVYLRAAEVTAQHMEIMGIATGVPDPVARAVVATGGRRAGLVDLEAQTKNALFRALQLGRAEGEGAEALVRRIGESIPAGPWRDVETRARVIARTETKHAQRVSVLATARENEVTQFMVLDARLGATDEVCEALNGRIVSAQEADQLAAEEHPNGTRDFVPWFGD